MNPKFPPSGPLASASELLSTLERGATLLRMIIKARVRGGRLVVDEPTDLPEGSEVVMISSDDYRSLQETAHLLQAPENARRLLESIAQLEQGEGKERKLDG